MPYFTIFKTYLVAPFELPLKDQKNLERFLMILEASKAGDIIQRALEKSKIKAGRPSYNPYRLFAAIIYGFAKHSGSLRKIEESMRYDLRFLFLMEGQIPSYVTIGDFLNNVVVTYQKELFSTMIQTIISTFKLSTDDVFLDGTKMEANANKYKFVWRPTTAHKNLNEKIRSLLVHYFDIASSKTSFLAKEIAEYLSLLANQIYQQNLSFETGSGIRSPQIVKDYKLLSTFMIKSLEYEERYEIMGPNRNSYYKTDHAATAMNLKADYYAGLGSTMHPAYNLQILVSKGFILHYYVSQDRTDLYPFTPCLDEFHHYFGFYPFNLCADAGYGSATNYLYMHDHHIHNFVKSPSWQNERDGKTIPLYTFDSFGNLHCLNGKMAPPLSSWEHSKPKSKYHAFYHIPDCSYCRFKSICQAPIKHKKTNNRTFQVNATLEQFKLEAHANLLSVKGIEMRVNRSSQVEGVYGIIKQNMDYSRLRRRGLPEASAELMLVCLGYNIRKLFTLIEGTAKLDYWQAPPNLQPEVFTIPSIKKMAKKRKRSLGKNETLRRSYKPAKRKRGG